MILTARMPSYRGRRDLLRTTDPLVQFLHVNDIPDQCLDLLSVVLGRERLRGGIGHRAPWLLWIYTAVTATMIGLNLASPTTMHFSDLLEVGGVVLPWGERIAQATAIPSRWPPLGDYLIIVFGGLCAYALCTDSGRSGGRSRTPLEAGLAVLIATIAVELLDPRRVSALPVDEFGFLAFVIVLGFGLRRGLADGPYLKMSRRFS